MVLNEVLIGSLKEVVRKFECIEFMISLFEQFNYKRSCTEWWWVDRKNTEETSNKQWLHLQGKTGTKHRQNQPKSEFFKQFTGKGDIVFNEVLIK